MAITYVLVHSERISIAEQDSEEQVKPIIHPIIVNGAEGATSKIMFKSMFAFIGG
jgi:hypothetical protein